MKFAFAFNGTRGDIQPAVVLAAELRRRGHDVVFGAPPNLVGFAARTGLDAKNFGYDTRAHMNSDLVRQGPRTGTPRQRLKALAEIRNYGWAQMVEEMSELQDGCDAIVTGFTTEQIAIGYAEAAGAKLITLHHAPILANPYVSPVPGASLSLPHWLNRASWKLFDSLFWFMTRSRENRLRADLGLEPATSALAVRLVSYPTLQIQAYDAVLVPELAQSWDSMRPFVGFIDPTAEQRTLIGEDNEPEPDLLEWIADGPAPIYFGFGSMPVPDPQGLLAAITKVCADLGERALISAGWNDFEITPSANVRAIGAVDHDRVFPMCSAIVHHGGAGTTAAAARAGVPSMVCWVGSDQPFWGEIVRTMGIGTSTRLKGLDAAKLRDGLGEIAIAECRDRARAFAATLTPPDAAVAAAADAIESHVLSAERVLR